jgi:hypothetical protein
MKPYSTALLIIVTAAALLAINGLFVRPGDFRLLISMTLFGVFVGILAVPEFDRRFRKSVIRRNLMAGGCTGVVISALYSF